MSSLRPYYQKVAFLSFFLGAGMELFMIKTGFYQKVTQLESERLTGSRDEREAFLNSLRAELEKQAAEKRVKIKLPPK
jgi:hypothetical protein